MRPYRAGFVPAGIAVRCQRHRDREASTCRATATCDRDGCPVRAYRTWPTRGRGIARAMCAHSLERARERGFAAMQFNLVISTNERAIRLWEAMGFETVGRLPGAFRHPVAGPVDALVMYRRL